MTLNELRKNQPARIVRFNDRDAALEAKLREIGFAEGDDVEIIHFGPVAGKPICVRLNQTLIALRRDEAALISVERVG